MKLPSIPILLSSLLLAAHVTPAEVATARLQWRNERLLGSPEKPSVMVAVRAYPKLPIKRPIALELEPGSDRIWVLENFAWETYRTTLKRFKAREDVAEVETLLEIPGKSEIAYGLCFHPKFLENGYFYLGTNGIGPGEAHHSRIIRYTLSRQTPCRIVDGSAKTILEWPSNGHNGAAAVFGNDGMLYVTTGDGSPNSDSLNAGQNRGSLLAKVLRIDVDLGTNGQPYRVPRNNPFVNNPEFRPETWAYGLRNPWRITNDPVSGQIWVGQNGQDLREFAHLLEKGANYGWSEFEGSRPFIGGRLQGPSPHTPPTIEHDHAAFRSLTGGFVYRGGQFRKGKRLPELQGAYIYGDYSTGRIWAARHYKGTLQWNRELVDTASAIAGFGTNPSGDILFADQLGDAIYRLEPAPVGMETARPVFPLRLSETGLFVSTKELQPMPGVLPYEINAPAWHDGAESQRLLALPEGGRAEFVVGGGLESWKAWNLPNQTVLVQTLTLPKSPAAEARRVETRLLVKLGGDWSAYSYLWQEDQTEAHLVAREGRKVTIAGRDWLVPSRTDCLSCHSRGANYALSLTNAQLNRPVHGKGAGGAGGAENQLDHFVALGIFGEPPASLPKPTAEMPRLTNPKDPAVPLNDRVKAYLATNCAHCHIPEGGGNSQMDLTPWVTAEKQHLLNATPQHGNLGLTDARLIRPGDASASVLPVRMMSRGPGQMPPVGSLHSDPEGIQLLIQWLLTLEK